MKGRNFTFGSFTKQRSFLRFAPFVDMTLPLRKMFSALFIIVLIQNVLAYDTNDLFIENYQYSNPSIVRYKRNDVLPSADDLNVSTLDTPVADKLISEATQPNINRPLRNQVERPIRPGPPNWKHPEQMERKVIAQPLNNIVSLPLYSI